MLSARHSGASLSAAYRRAIVGPRTVQGGLPAYSSAEPRRINDIRADLRGFLFLTSIPHQNLTILIHCFEPLLRAIYIGSNHISKPLQTSDSPVHATDVHESFVSTKITNHGRRNAAKGASSNRTSTAT